MSFFARCGYGGTRLKQAHKEHRYMKSESIDIENYEIVEILVVLYKRLSALPFLYPVMTSF